MRYGSLVVTVWICLASASASAQPGPRNITPRVPTPGVTVVNPLGPLDVCHTKPNQGMAFVMNPRDINPSPTASSIPQFATGKITQNGVNFDATFPNFGYDGIWLEYLQTSAAALFPFDELFLKFTAQELIAHSAAIAGTTIPVCYVRIKDSTGTVLPVMKSGGGNLTMPMIGFNPLPFSTGYYYDVEVYTFSATAMTKVQAYRINFKTCSATTAATCP